MVVPLNVIFQKRGNFIQVNYEDIDITVIIEITEGTASAGMSAGKPWSGLDHRLEAFITEVVKDGPRTLVRIVRELLFKLRIYAPRNKENIGPTVIIEINNVGSPTDV